MTPSSPTPRSAPGTPEISGQVGRSASTRWIATGLAALLTCGALSGAVLSGGRLPTSNPRVVPERAQPQVGQAAHGSDAADSPAAAPPLRPAEPAPADSSSPRREVASPVQPAPARLVRINAASAAELELLPDIGPALAARIVEFRIANGPFRGPADLDKVRGIGEKTLTRLAPLISFEVVPPGGG